jgi:replicative DNA helicase
VATLNDVLTERIPPHDVAVERALLGAILLEGGAAWSRIGARLEADDFYLARHRLLWSVCRDLVADGLEVDLATARHALRDSADDLGEAPGVFLAELADQAALLSALPSYAAIVRSLSARRETIRIATDAISRAYAATEPAVDVAREAAHALARLAEAAGVEMPRPPATVHRVSTIVDEVVAALEAGTMPALLELPYPGLNHFLGGGLGGGELVLLGAWPGVGKSAIATEIGRHAARHGRSVLIMSKEMKRHALARRLIAQEAQIDAMGLRRGRLELGELASLRYHLSAIRGLPIWITDDAGTVEDVARFAREIAWQPRLGLVIIDYLQLVDAPPGAESHRLAVEGVSTELKALAMDLDVPVICLSALSRAGEGHRGRRPTKADLRESGKLEHDADIILLLHRPDQMAPATELIIDKARDASVGMVDLLFHPATVRFTEVSQRAEG